jgi:glycerol-3-phosphate O-acyltransferase
MRFSLEQAKKMTYCKKNNILIVFFTISTILVALTKSNNHNHEEVFSLVLDVRDLLLGVFFQCHIPS